MAGALVGIGLVPAQASTGFGVGSTSLAKPAAGGRYIYVSVSGRNQVSAPTGAYSSGQPFGPVNRVKCLTTDNLPAWVGMLGWSRDRACPEPTEAKPLATVQAGVAVARPGDVIVVRGGKYYERVGYQARPATSTRPIVLQNSPGERVEVRGWLKLTDANYWKVEGLRWYWDKKETQGAQAVVSFFGGTGWTFARNEIRDSRGVANMLVGPKSGAKTTSQRKAYAPHNYTIDSNCILYQRGPDKGLDHNLYLMPTIWSSGGKVTHNLMVSAPNGGNIKAAGSKDPNGSPWDVKITNNTLLGGASGVIFGLKAKDIDFSRNVVSLSRNSGPYDGGVKTYNMTYPNSISVRNNVISTYKYPVRETGRLAPHQHIKVSGTINSSAAYSGSIASCNITFTKPWLNRDYGHRSGW